MKINHTESGKSLTSVRRITSPKMKFDKKKFVT